MPRKARIDAPGALHHIIARGIGRRRIFEDDADRDFFGYRFGPILEETNTQCFAWALIPNHFHLLLKSGDTPISTVMKRILTAYSMRYNRRHRRSGHLFQNRYKSILCQEDTYLKVLVRYIHLNPIRAKLIDGMPDLDRYPYTGHSVLMGEEFADWQDAKYILKFFGEKVKTARKRYREFVEKGIPEGRKPELTGGGLIRSAGGWSAIKALRKTKVFQKGDERILGDGDFVLSVLSTANEAYERKYRLKAAGIDFDLIAKKIAEIFNLPLERVFAPGKQKKIVEARSLLCYWATNELNISQTWLSNRLGLSQAAVNLSVSRGRAIAKENNLEIEKLII